MQIIMSPAKLMNFDTPIDKNIVASNPKFTNKVEQLIEVCQKLSISDISKIMKVNAKIATSVFGYFQSFDFLKTPSGQASLVYNGVAYKCLDAKGFDDNDCLFAQNHLNLISGMYGILKPFDIIKPYRLEMSRKIQPNGYKDLYEFWQDDVNYYLSQRLHCDDEKVVINVASDEYSKVLKKDKLPFGAKVIDIKFLQQEGGNLRQVVVYSKKARGLMARFIIKNKITKSEDVKAFNYEDYYFSPTLSIENQWFFIR